MFELLEFYLVLAKQGALVHVLIYSGLILDFLRASCELQSLVTLAVGLESRRDHGNHRSFAVAPKRVLQEPRKLGIAEGNVNAICFFREGIYYVSQR